MRFGPPTPRESGMMLLGCGSSGGGVAATPQPEITELTATANVAGALHGKHFLISDAGGRVSVTMDGGALAQQFEVVVSGNPVSVYATHGVGRNLTLVSQAGVKTGFWFQTGTESEPVLSVDGYVVVDITAASSSGDIQDALNAAISISGFSLVAANTFEQVYAGAVPFAHDANDSSATITINLEGRDAAVDPGVAARNIMVPLPDDCADTDTATSTHDALNADGAWTSVRSTATLTITDAANGARTDATDGNTGFTISTLQQGA